jgi:hypothetical protein
LAEKACHEQTLYNGAPEKCLTQVGSGHTHKHKTWLEKLARLKHSSLLGSVVSTKEKSVVNKAITLKTEHFDEKR